MSVLIRGMEMPESCYRCPMANDDFYLCGATEKYLENDSDDRRPEWCPLVEIPTPHGRLGDLDKLKAQYVHGKADDEIESAWISNIRRAIANAPTVIEAEGSEE